MNENPDYTDENIEKLAREVIDGLAWDTCLQILFENQIELYKHSSDIFMDDWLEMEMEE